MPAFAIADLQPFHKNPRRGDVQIIADSLAKLGQYKPIVVNRGTSTGRKNEVLAGNHTLQAAQVLGWTEIDCHFVDVDEETASRIVLVDNRASDKATYDDAALVELIKDLPTLEATGWDEAEIQALVLGIEQEADLEPDEDVDDLPVIREWEPVTKPGDVWVLGAHRLVCGDATDPKVLARLFGDERADVIWTDPPYGVEYVGKTKDALTIKNDGAEGLPALLRDAFDAAAQFVRPGAPVYVAHSDTERLTFETALRDTGYSVRQNLIWVKNTIVLGHSDYHYKHEPILEAEAPDAETGLAEASEAEDEGKEHEPILYGFTPAGKGLGRLGRGGPRWYGDNSQSTVIEVPKPPRNAEHPTMKPVKLILAMLKNSLRPGGIVFDPFGGSGSTLIAAIHRHSRGFLTELDPHYCDVIVKRWQEHTGLTPEREGDGPYRFD